MVYVCDLSTELIDLDELIMKKHMRVFHLGCEKGKEREGKEGEEGEEREGDGEREGKEGEGDESSSEDDDVPDVM